MAAKYLGRGLLCLLAVAIMVPVVRWAVGDHYLRKAQMARAEMANHPTPEHLRDLSGIAMQNIGWALDWDPTSPFLIRYRWQLRDDLRNLGQVSAAGLDKQRAELLLALRQTPTWDLIYQDLSILCVNSGQAGPSYAPCQPTLLTALRLNPTRAYYYELRGDVLNASLPMNAPPEPAQVEDICRNYGRALMLIRYPDHAAYLKVAGRAYDNCLGLTRDYQVLRLLNPWFEEDFVRLGSALARLDDAAWERVRVPLIADLPNGPRIHEYRALAQTLGKNGRPADGLLVVRAYLKANPDDPRGWQLMLGYLNAFPDAFGDEAVREAVREALSSSRPDPKHWSLLAGYACRLKDYAGAERLLRTVLELHPGSFEALAALGECLASSGQLEKARLALQKALTDNPGTADVWTNLAEVDRQLGNQTSAVEDVHRALKLDPNHRRARLILKKMGVY